MQDDKKTRIDFNKLTITDDFVFSTTMRRNKRLCIGFIERILGVKIRDIEYIGTQETMDFSREHKSIRLDVYVEDDANTVYDLEMQTTIDSGLSKRSRYYHALMDLSQTEKGILYSDLKKSCVIFICTKDPFGCGESIYRFEKTCKERPGLVLGDEIETVFVNAEGSRTGLNKDFAALLDYIAESKASDGFTQELDRKVSDVITDKGWRAEYMTFEMKLQERWRDGFEGGRAVGMEDGRTQGRAEGKTEGKVEGRAEGKAEGRAEGRAEGAQEMDKLNNQLFAYLLSHNLTDEALKATRDEAFKRQLIAKYCTETAQ